MLFAVYVIKNESSGKIYIGHSADLQNRLARHNHHRGYWHLVYQENFSTRVDAVAREKELKSFRGREFLRTKINRA